MFYDKQCVDTYDQQCVDTSDCLCLLSLLSPLSLLRENAQNEEVESYREILNRYTLKGARDFLKIARRLEKERRNDEFLTQKMIETDSDLVMVSASIS